MTIAGMMIEVIKLSDLAAHNGIDLEVLKEEINFNGNMCHLYEINDSRDDSLDADGRDDTVLVDLWH
jgi:hypothetical protein